MSNMKFDHGTGSVKGGKTEDIKRPGESIKKDPKQSELQKDPFKKEKRDQ